MHPVLRSPAANPSKALFFVDPCSGLGSIPIEIAAIAKRDGKKIVSLAADNELPSLENAAINATKSSVECRAGLNGLDKGLLWTGYGKRHSGGFREGTIDGVVTDLPWGIRELSSKAISALYPALLRFLGEAVIDGGTGVFLCQRDRVFLAAVQSNYKMWEVLEPQVSICFMLNIIALTDSFSTLSRKPTWKVSRFTSLYLRERIELQSTVQ